METDSRSDEEIYGSTVLQDSAHSVELVAHLVGSVFSNDYTKERAKELGSAISQTESYTFAIETIDKLETQIDNASEQFMKEHPHVQTAFMASQEKLDDAISYVTKEAQTFASNHPEITNDLKSIVEIAAVVPAVKAAKVATGAREGIVTYTAQEAEREIGKIDLDALKPKEIEQELHRIINHLDTTPKDVSPHATTVFYSGVPHEAVEVFEKNENYALLNNTEAFKFLQEEALEGNDGLKNALKKVYDTDKIDFNERNTPSNIFINGDDSVFPRQQGSWDIISHQFASEAKGDVKTLIGERATPHRVFYHTELEAMATSKSIHSVDGIDKKTLFKELDTMPSAHHQLNHFKTTHYTRNEIAQALEVNNPLELTPKQMDDFLATASPEAKDIASKIDTFKIDIHTQANKDMGKELLENRQSSPIIQRGEAVSLNKTDLAFASLATVAIANEAKESNNTTLDQEALEQRMDPQSHQTINITEIEDRQDSKIDTTAKAEEHINTLFPHLQPTNTNQIQHHKREEENQDESNSLEYTELRDTNSNATFEKNNDSIEDDSFSLLKNHRPIGLEDNLPLQTEESELTEDIGQHIYDNIAQKYGNNDNYGNDYDRGMEID